MLSWGERGDRNFLALLLVAICFIYIPAITNIVIFDDAQIFRDGSLRPNLLSTTPRFVTHLTYEAVDQLFNHSIIAQKVFNLVLHGVVIILLYFLSIVLLEFALADIPASTANKAVGYKNRVRVGVTLFALNPSAVYATAYLVQRSIVLATAFTLLMAISFVYGLRTRKHFPVCVALVFYGLAVLSKESAVMSLFILPVLFIVIRKPAFREIAMAIAIVLAIATFISAYFLRNYQLSLLVPYEPSAPEHLAQVGLYKTEEAKYVLALHALNQLNLFFAYGFIWLFPNPNWMSIDLQPIFPSLGTIWNYMPLGLLFLILFAVATHLLLLGSNKRRLIGAFILIPMILFQTEIWVIRIQEPFAIYRSYLWAISLPGLIALALTPFSRRHIVAAGIGIAAIHGGMANNRARTFASDMAIWSDAIEKSNSYTFLKGFGIWRHYINRGAAYLSRGEIRNALADFHRAENLGALHGVGQYNSGVVFQMLGQHDVALASLTIAESKNPGDSLLKYRIGESLYALNRPEEAIKRYQSAASLAADTAMGFMASLRTAELHIVLQQFSEAKQVLADLLQLEPNNPRIHVGMGMAHLGLGSIELARTSFAHGLEDQPNANAYYGLALLEESQANVAEAKKWVARAIALEPNNATFTQYNTHLLQWVK